MPILHPPSRARRRPALRVLTGAAAVLLAGTGVAAGVRPAAAADTATINGATTYQTMTGFGASEAFGEASTVMNASASVQQQALGLLYSPTSGAGLTMLRNEISADSGSTIEPSAPASPTAAPAYASLASISQDAGQLWFAQQIKADYGVTNVFADAWSAPPFMKTNDSASGGGAVCGLPGATCSSGDWRQAYANYLVQYAKDYAAAGDPLTYIGPENEANLSTSYDSMQLSPAQTASFLDVLGPALASSGLSTKMECCATEGWDYAQQYASAIEADPTASAGHRGVHQPRLHAGPGLGPARLDQAGLADRVVHVRDLGPGLGRRHRRVRADLGAAHLHRPDRGRPERVPVLVGQHHPVGERRQRGPHPDQRLHRGVLRDGCGRSPTTAGTSGPARCGSGRPARTARWT